MRYIETSGSLGSKDCLQQYRHNAKAVSNRRPIAEPKSKMGLLHNTYSLQQSTYMENPFYVSVEV